MRRILPDIDLWSRLSPPHGYDFNGHLVHLPGLVLCVDPVEPDEATLAALIGARPSRIVITNRNHTRAALLLRERTGARIALHPADAEHARQQGVEPDDELQVGAEIGPLRVVDLSGKSPGEIGLHWPDRRLLLVGDALIGDPPGRCRLLRPQVIDDLPRLKASVRRALELDFDTLLVGDGVPILGGAHARVAELVGSFEPA